MLMAKQNEFTEGFFQNTDLRGLENEMIEQVRTDMGFQPEEIINRSTWWGSERVGAFQCAGTYEGKPAILKVQGVEPSSSEIDAIDAVNSATSDAAIRAPFLYANRRWDANKGFEALIVEQITSDKLVHLPTTEIEVQKFFDLYTNYSSKLKPNPWIEKPTISYGEIVQRNTKDQLEASMRNYPNHPFRKPSDSAIIAAAVEVVTDHYKAVNMLFQHCHISTDDVFLPNGIDPRHIFTSNFVWGWRPKFYDAVVAYHHFPRLLIDRGLHVTEEMVAMQTNWWKKQIAAIPKNNEERTLLHTVMLELAINRLAIDDLTVDPKNPLAGYLIESTRRDIMHLTTELSQKP
jgi:hypothetical protein